jgi:hypothetical protein
MVDADEQARTEVDLDRAAAVVRQFELGVEQLGAGQYGNAVGIGPGLGGSGEVVGQVGEPVDIDRNARVADRPAGGELRDPDQGTGTRASA